MPLPSDRIGAERPGHAAPPAIAEARAGLARAVAAGTWATEPPGEVVDLGGVGALRWVPDGPSRAIVLHFHGGGYRMGCPEMEGPFALALARATGMTVIVPRYRLAPEHPFPAALNDAAAVLAALGDEARLVLSGGSAGGGVAAALAEIAAARGRAIAGLALHSPWLDLAVDAPSYAANTHSDALFSEEAARLAARLYLQGHPAGDPLASPLLADPACFPPTFLSVGTGEVVADDALRFHARLAAAGRPARLLAIPGMEHVAVTRNRAAPGAAQVFAALVEFLAALP